jgi:hypothetical protein
MWNTFAAVSGGAAGGLTGLIFPVVSFRFETLGASEEYRSRAAQVLSLFLTVTVLRSCWLSRSTTRLSVSRWSWSPSSARRC